jgi:hypothetical protein
MSLNDETIVAKIALRRHASADAVRTAMNALRRGGGSMAQFSHQEFGGMAQWSRGMTMVGDMFNAEMKSKLDAICTDLAAHLASSPPTERAADAHDRDQDDTRAPDVSYRSQPSGAPWWPGDLGTPGSTGAQNDMRYAVFPSTRRLALSEAGRVTVYDTGDHNISGVSQSQSTDRTLTFTGQNALVRVSDLTKVSG